MSFQKILVAVDKGPIAAHAVQVARELASGLNARLALVHVAQPAVPFGSEAGIPRSELMDMVREEGLELLAAIHQESDTSEFAHEFLEGGDPAAEIVKVARRWPADVIVMGTHGREGISRALQGSVAETVMRHAPCPVLVVRGA